MTDRELLEKAARLVGEWPSPEPFEHVLRRWNPLTDDGDALRLAVACGIDLGFGNDKVIAGDHQERYTHRANGAATDADRSTATRRAIVRAAAALEDR